MRSLLSLIILIASLPIFSQKIELENSVFFFNTLVDCVSESQMIDKCNFYQLIDQGVQEEFHVYEAPDGNIIRFKIDQHENGYQIPIIEIITNQRRNQIEKHLSKIGYKKEGKIYVRSHKYGITKTYCKIEKAESNKTKLLVSKTTVP